MYINIITNIFYYTAIIEHELVSELENQFVNIEIYQHGELDKAKPFCTGLDMARFKENFQLFKEVKKLKGINKKLK